MSRLDDIERAFRWVPKQHRPDMLYLMDRVRILESALVVALDGWESADSSADSQFRISTDPPCEDEARIAQLRKVLP